MKKSRVLKSCILFPVCTILILSAFLLTYKVNVYAASEQTYFPMDQNVHNKFNQSVLDFISNTYDDNYYYFCKYSGENSGYIGYRIIYFSKDVSWRINASINNNGYQFSLIRPTDLSQTHYWRALSYNKSTGVTSAVSVGDSFESMFTNLYSTGYNPDASYVSNYNLTTTNGDLVLIYDYVPPVEVPEGSDPTAFNDSNLNIDSSLNATNVPSLPSISTPTIPSAPTWDTSNPVQSVFDVIYWGFQVVSSFFRNLFDIISGWIGYIGQLLSYLVQKLFNYLNAIVNWLYQQFLNWLTPYLKMWQFISGLLFSEDDQLGIYDLVKEIYTFISSWLNTYWSNSFVTSFWNNFSNNLQDSLSYFRKVVLFFEALTSLGMVNNEFSITGFFTSLFVPSTQLVIQAVIEHDDFDFIGTSKVVLADAPRILSQLYNVTPSPVFHVPSCTYHGVEIGDFDISFSWFAPYKVYYDVIVSTFLVIGWIYWFYLSFGSHLKGSNIIDFSGDDSYHRNNIGF